MVELYCDKMGLSARNWPFYEVYGLFRLAVIAQQIYYRYHHKQTRNPAFKNYWIMTNYLALRCNYIMQKSRRRSALFSARAPSGAQAEKRAET